MIDENLVLGSIGISSGIIPLSSASVAYKPGDSRQAGQSTNLQFSFKVSTLIPKESYLVLRLGKVGSVPFVIGEFPSCKQYTINNY